MIDIIEDIGEGGGAIILGYRGWGYINTGVKGVGLYYWGIRVGPEYWSIGVGL